MSEPSPGAEIRLVSLRTVRGANFWSSRPVTRLDMHPGAFDEISSAQVPGTAQRLLELLPGLVEHRCNIGKRGGFLTRLRQGTYAPHIVEHVALELQAMIGHEVGFGRARGGDRPGEYTVVFEHLHAEVGLRAAAHALDIVQQVFAGVLPRIDHLLAELEALKATPDLPAPSRHILCGLTGGGALDAFRGEVARRGYFHGTELVEVSPSYLLDVGLPYGSSRMAVVLDVEPAGLPERYREPELGRRLFSVVVDAVPHRGLVVAPAGEPELHQMIHLAGRALAVFGHRRGGESGAGIAEASASARDGHIIIEHAGHEQPVGELNDRSPQAVQLAAALASFAADSRSFSREGDDAVHA